MAWITITQDDLNNYIVSALVTSLNEAALGDSQTDRLTKAIADVTAQIRMAVSSVTSNVLDEDSTTIPQSFRPDACWVIAGLLAAGLGVPLTDQQTAELTNARERIISIKRDGLTVEKPDVEDTTPDSQAGSGVSMITPQSRVFTATSMNGL